MTKQEIFDKGVAGILAQGCASVDMNALRGRCRYRTKDGHACVIGQCLTDEQVAAFGDENPGAYERRVTDALGLDHEDRWFAGDLQAAHDQAAIHSDGLEHTQRSPEEFLELFREKARAVAVRHGLSTEVLDR